MFADFFKLYRSREKAGASVDMYDNLDFTIGFRMNLLRLKAVYVAG